MNAWLSAYGGYFIIPFIAAFAGWGTNWLAIKMTFYPLEYVGKFPFGWRGVVPSRIRKFATGMVDTTIGRIGGLPAMVDALDMEEVKTYFLEAATPMIAEAVHGLMREQQRVLWENLPAPTKKLVFQVVEMEMNDGIDALADDIHDHFERLLDLRELVVRKCEENPDLLNQMVFACASKELSFLVFSGAFFGFAFGVVQALVWFFVPQWWVLPFFGFLVGTLTNWIAIQLIFTPLEPKKYGPFTFQGLFLKRQKEISEEFSRVFTEDVLTAREVVHTMVHGERSERTMAMLRAHISEIMESKLIVQLITQSAVGPEGYADLKDAALEKAIQYTEELAEDSSFNKEQARVLQKMLHKRISAQPPAEFQDLVRPIFHEDEWILVAIGGALGALVGWGQLVLLFGERLIANGATLT
ncbi:MAG: hypothetical protein GWP63_13290 [Haliea sp.]|nr:hypothetical protein [Haliea sp.]